MAPRDCRLNHKLTVKLGEPDHVPITYLVGAPPAVFAKLIAFVPTCPVTYAGDPVAMGFEFPIVSVAELSNGKYAYGETMMEVKVGLDIVALLDR